MSVQLHVPAIGTGLILRKPWSFRLYFERRNEKMLSALTGHKFGWGDFCGGSYNHKTGRYDKPDFAGKKFGSVLVRVDTFGIPEDDDEKEAMELSSTWKHHQPMAYVDVTLPAGAALTVDRIYVRKGVDAYNSLTFWLKKPAKLKKPKKGEPVPPVDPNHEFLTKIGGVRFWAKLPEVNQIVCDII
jgi:hypothetical protein